MEPRSRSTSRFVGSRRAFISCVERFLWFGFGVFVTIFVFHSYKIHTTDQRDRLSMVSMGSFGGPRRKTDVTGDGIKSRRTRTSMKNKNKRDRPKAQPQRIDRPSLQNISSFEKILIENTPKLSETKTSEQETSNKRHDDRFIQHQVNSTASINRRNDNPQTLQATTKGIGIGGQGRKISTEYKEHDPLNILLLYGDDWTMRVMGKLDPNVRTPNIDKLADNGMLFTNNCVTSSVCWISRTTLVTGVYYSRHLQFAPHSTNVFTTNPWNETLFPKLKNAGYYTGLMGKWHLPQTEPEMTIAFDQRDFYYGDHWSSDYSAYGSDEVAQITDKNVADAMKFLQERPRDKPFFLKVSYFATHAWDTHEPPYVPKNETRHKYYPSSMFVEPPKTATDWHWQNLPRFFTDINEGRNRWRRRFEPDYFQESIKDLYAMATEVDTTVGILMDELKKQNILDKTMVIFTTDNGNLHGEHGLAEKWYPFEESLRVPLVIFDPRMPKNKRGTTNDEWTLSVDLAPTILGAANLEKSSFMQGRDLSQLYMKEDEDKKIDWRHDWYYEWNMGDPLNASGHPQTDFIDAAQALISTEWKYVFWPEQNYEQLFHRRIDPFDEWDLIRKDNLMNTSNFNATAIGTLQTTMAAYEAMKARFLELRAHVIAGKPV